MKIIHTADIHLGSKMDSGFPKEISDRRKEELRNTFKRLAEYARINGVEAVILAGDVFDSDAPFKKDKEFFYSVVKNTPQTDFLYLKGNHDIAADYTGEAIPNLKTFSGQWQSYRYGDVLISGIETGAENASSLYSTLDLPEDCLNIVVMHGQAGDVSGKDKVNLKKLRDKHIDYLALGHVHKAGGGALDSRGEYAYSGCLEGRGFDETGEHGFFLLETGRKITRTFVPFSERRIEEVSADVTGVKDAYSAYLAVKRQVEFKKRNIYRVNLVGETEFDVEGLGGDVAAYLAGDCLFADVKDKTVKKLDIGAFEGDLSLRGEFVRVVSAAEGIPEERKKRIIALGLKALGGRNIEL